MAIGKRKRLSYRLPPEPFALAASSCGTATMNDHQDDDLIDAREAARLLGLKPSTLEIWRWAGKGPQHRVIGTRSVRYLRADILAYRDRRVRTSAQPRELAKA
jgi:predicted DNA-binding transcriptional regulator AlpA